MPPTEPETFAVRLRRARRLRRFSQSDLAEACCTDTGTVSRHEREGPYLEQSAEAYASALGVSVEWLLSGRGPGPSEHGDIVEKYLKTPVGKTASRAVAVLLLNFPYPSAGLVAVTERDVHRVRELIEFNRVLGSTMPPREDAKPKPRRPRR